MPSWLQPLPRAQGITREQKQASTPSVPLPPQSLGNPRASPRMSFSVERLCMTVPPSGAPCPLLWTCGSPEWNSWWNHVAHQRCSCLIYWVRIEAQANLCQLVCILFGKCIPTMQLAGETIQDGSTSMLPCCMDPKPDHFHWYCGRTYSPVNYHNCGTSPLKSWAHHFLFVAITIFNRQITYNL